MAGEDFGRAVEEQGEAVAPHAREVHGRSVPPVEGYSGRAAG